MRLWVFLLLSLAVLLIVVIYRAGDIGLPATPSPAERVTSGSMSEEALELRGTEEARGAPRARGGRVIGVVQRAGHGLPARLEIAPLRPLEGRAQWDFVTQLREAVTPPGAVANSTRAGDDGRYAFEGLAPGRYEVRATTEGGGFGLARCRLPGKNALAVADIEIAWGPHAVDVVATHADGTPFSGWILLSHEGPANGASVLDEAIARAATDEAGRAHLDGLPAGILRITALAHDRYLASTACELPRNRAFHFVVDEGTRRLSGRVTRRTDGSAIEGAQVFVWTVAQGLHAFHVEARTEAGGRFELPVPQGEAWLVVRAGGYAPVTLTLAGQEEDLEIPLSRGATLHGRVVATSGGTPVAGARVVAVPVPPSGGYRYEITSTFSDRDGYYTLAMLPRLQVALFVCGGGWVSPEFMRWKEDSPPNLCVPDPDTPSSLDLEVVPTVTLQGRVVQGDGAPVARCEVRLRPSFYARTLYERSPLGTYARSYSDEAGRFELSDLLPGVAHPWMVFAADGRIAEGLLAAASPGQHVESTFTLPVQRFERVRVVAAADGRPIAGARVLSLPAEHPGFAVPWSAGARTGEDGIARVGPLGEREYDVLVRAEGHALARDPLPFADDGARGATPPVTVELERGLTIAGRVVLPDGSPAVGGEVFVRTWSLNVGSRPEERCLVSDDAAFSISTLAPGSYTVTASCPTPHGRLRVSRRVVAPATDLLLELEPRTDERFLRMTFLGPSGTPPPQGMARLFQGDPPREACASWERKILAGVLETRLLDRGRQVWVEAFDFRDAASEGLLWAPVLLGPFAPGEDPGEVRLSPSVSLGGRIIDVNGKGVANVRIRAYPEGDAPRSRGPWEDDAPHEEIRSDDGGHFRLRRLASGTYRLRIEPPPGFAAPDDLVVVADGSEHVIAIASSLSCVLRILDADGRPVDDVEVLWRPTDGGTSRSERTDTTGHVTLPDLDAQLSYRLTLRPPRKRHDLFKRTIEAWRPVDGSIALERAYEVRGRLIDEAQRPVPGISVACRPLAASASTQLQKTRADGDFHFRGLPGGSVELAVRDRMTLGGQTEEIRREVQAGATGVVLEITVGARLAIRIDGWRSHWPFRSAILTPGGGTESVRHGTIDAEGHVLFYCLDPAVTYALWVQAPGDGQVVYAPGLVPAEGEQVVATRPGGVLQGAVVSQDGTPAPSVKVRLYGEGLSMQTSTGDDGAFLFEGVPPGRWTVRAWTHSPAQHPREGTATGTPGTPVHIRLTEH